ncbi:hypothetical protein [Variovorax paradoxus]|uniref:hypothetical protein n=1 Tax=Variovorax paradoxus TaxID=34073 RepID=UPI001ABCD66D
MTTPTSTPVPSEKPLDLLYNAGALDVAMSSAEHTFLDRFGNERKTWAGIEAYIAENGLLPQMLEALGLTEMARDQAFASTNQRESTAIGLADSTIAVGGWFSAPLADGSWQAYHKTSISVATPVGEPSATAKSVLFAPQAVIARESSITVDMVAKTFTIGANSAFYYKGGRAPIPAGTTPFTTTDVNGMMRLHYNPTTGDIGMAAVGGTAMPSGTVILAYFANQNAIADDPDGRIIVVLSGNRTNGPMEAFVPLIAGAVRINTQAGNLAITTSAAGFVPTKRGLLVVPSGQNVPISAPSGLVIVSVNLATGALVAANTGAAPPTNWPVIAVVYNNVLFKAADSNITLVTTAGLEYVSPMRNSSSAYLVQASLVVNLQTKTLTLDSAGGVAVWSDGYRTLITSQTVSFTMPFVGGLLFVYLDKATGTVAAIAANGVPPAGCAILCMVYLQQLDAPLDTRRQIKLIDSTGSDVPSASGATFDPLVQRMILPDTMYFLPGTPMRLYRAPCFADYQNMVRTDIAFWLDTGGTSIADRFQPVGDSIKIDPAQLGATFRLGYRNNAQPDKRYIKTITAAVAAPGSLAGKTIKYLRIADSLGEVRMMAEVKAQLELLGATVTPVGTYSSVASEGLRGEARGFWAYRNFIGKDNLSTVDGTPTPHTLAPAGPDTTKFANPFLRLATGTDTTNHPTWCFRNTGAEKELSYTDDPVKTGNFYRFDFGWYRTQHSVPAPDIVVIAPWANDINLNRAASAPTSTTYSQAERLQYMRLALEIMITSVKEDLPNVKILILPAPAWCSDSVNDPRWLAEAAPWIEACMKDVSALSATYSGLHLVGSWPFMSEDWIYPYVTSPAAPDLSATNNTKVNSIFDRVHFGEVGQAQSAAVEVACVANVMP